MSGNGRNQPAWFHQPTLLKLTNTFAYLICFLQIYIIIIIISTLRVYSNQEAKLTDH